MAATFEESVEDGTSSSNSQALPTWTPANNDFLIAAAGTRQTRSISSVTGNGQTWGNELTETDGEAQETVSAMYVKASSPTAGQATVNIDGSNSAIAALGIRFSGIEGVEATATNSSPTDNADCKIDITTLTDGAIAIAIFNHRQRTFTEGASDTVIQKNQFYGGGGNVLSCTAVYQVVATAGTVTLGKDSSLNSATDWAAIAFALEPSPEAAGARLVDIVPLKALVNGGLIS